MVKNAFFGMAMLLMLCEAAPAQYSGWKYSGSVFLITTPEGANVPASASEDGFPLLVRLHKDFFDFSQAKAKGEDIRFSTSTGTPLAYQVEEWDAINGTASVWVRIPTIKGNARQEIKLYSKIPKLEFPVDDQAGQKMSSVERIFDTKVYQRMTPPGQLIVIVQKGLTCTVARMFYVSYWLCFFVAL